MEYQDYFGFRIYYQNISNDSTGSMNGTNISDDKVKENNTNQNKVVNNKTSKVFNKERVKEFKNKRQSYIRNKTYNLLECNNPILLLFLSMILINFRDKKRE